MSSIGRIGYKKSGLALVYGTTRRSKHQTPPLRTGERAWELGVDDAKMSVAVDLTRVSLAANPDFPWWPNRAPLVMWSMGAKLSSGQKRSNGGFARAHGCIRHRCAPMPGFSREVSKLVISLRVTAFYGLCPRWTRMLSEYRTETKTIRIDR
jgi:hypothetical protein